MKDANLFIPITVIGYILPDSDGNGGVVLTPDWKIEKIQAAYNKGISGKCTRSYLEQTPKVFNNYNFSIKINKKSKEVFVKLDSTTSLWTKCIFENNSESVNYLYFKELFDLVLNNEGTVNGDEVEYVNEFSFGFSTEYPGIPFPISQRDTRYGEYIRRGSKQMMFTTASLYGTKKTKSWKVGHRYMDSLGNSYTIIGEIGMNDTVKDLLIKCLTAENDTKKSIGSDRDFVTAVVEILNNNLTTTPPSTSFSKVFLYIKDIDTDYSTINERGVDVYDSMKDYTIQILPSEKTCTAYDLGEVFSKEIREKNPISLTKIAENTLKCFKFGDYSTGSFPIIPLMSGSYSLIVENLIYVSSLIDPVTGLEVPEIKDMLKKVIEERLKECILLNLDDIDPKVGYTNPISTIDVVKKTSIFMSRLLKHGSFFEDAVNYISSFLNFKDLFEKVKEEIAVPQDYVFSSWDNYVRYVNYTTLPYLLFDAIFVKVEVDNEVIDKPFELPEKEKLRLGVGLSDVIEKITNRALLFNGVGVHTYSTKYSIEGGEKIEERVNILITFDDIKNYFGGEELNDVLKNDILSKKFYKLSLNILYTNKKVKEDEK